MKRKLLFLLIFAAIAGNGFAQISFKGTAPRAVVAGQQFRVIYTLTYSEERGKDILIPETNGIQVLFGPTVSTSMMTNIVNGNRTTTNTLSHTYVMMAEKEGEYTLSPASIKVGNSEYKSNELKITVLPPDQEVTAANTNAQAAQQESGSQAKASNGEIFIRMIVSKSSVYENEGFLVSFKLYTTVDVTGFENMKFPEFEGFVAQEIELPENKQLQLENYQGRNYRSVVLKQSILYPQRAGKINIGQGKYEAVVREVAQQQRSRSFFDDFFAPAYTNVKKTLTSQAVSIDVKPLPGNQPTTFSGAVGDYKLSSTISATSLKANEPVTIKLTLSGTGNIKMLKNPEIVFPNDFEIYDPKIDVNTKVSANGVSGTKTIEYYAVPRYAGNFTIPSIQFSYFDLNSGSYKTLSTNTYQLQVAPGEGGSGENATIVTGINKEDVRFVGADIRHIKTGHFNFQKGDFFFGTFEYWLWYIIPLVLFIALFIIYRKQVAENANIALMRTKKANRAASKRLKTANKYLQSKQYELFYDETLKAIWGYLSDKLTIPVANLTKDNVEVELLNYGVTETLIREFMDILNTAEFARFAPTQGQGDMDELYQKTVNAINQMEKL